MTTKPKDEVQSAWPEIKELYHAVLEAFYQEERPEKAAPKALRLLRLLDMHDPNAETLLGMSGRWLVAELDDDTVEAVRFREKELAVLRNQIKKGLIPAGGLEPDEFSDRLDLLALNYLDLKRYDDAIAALEESEAFCKEQGIPFDGQDIRADVKRAMRRKKPLSKKPSKAKAG